jgi:hypothetical protein
MVLTWFFRSRHCHLTLLVNMSMWMYLQADLWFDFLTHPSGKHFSRHRLCVSRFFIQFWRNTLTTGQQIINLVIRWWCQFYRSQWCSRLFVDRVEC